MSAWHAASAHISVSYTHLANIQDLEGVDNYAAMILRKDNPHFVDYVSEFNNTVNMLSLIHISS